MIRSVIVPDGKEIQKLASFEIVKNSGNGNRVPLLLNDKRQQLVLLENGTPRIGYRVACENEQFSKRKGFEVIEKFLGKFEGRKHLVMLYDDPGLARRVEFLYIKKGLEIGQGAFYVIPEDDVESPETIRKQMEFFGFQTERLIRTGKLRIVGIPNPGSDREGFRSGCEKILNSLLRDQTSVRMVLHVRYLFNSDEEIRGHADFERFIESSFANFPGSMLCNHYVGKNTHARHGEWTKRMFSSHDLAFVISSGESGLPFGM